MARNPAQGKPSSGAPSPVQRGQRPSNSGPPPSPGSAQRPAPLRPSAQRPPSFIQPTPRPFAARPPSGRALFPAPSVGPTVPPGTFADAGFTGGVGMAREALPLSSVYDGSETGEFEDNYNRPFTREDRKLLHWNMQAVFCIAEYNSDERVYCLNVVKQASDSEKHALLRGYKADFEFLSRSEVFMSPDDNKIITRVTAEEYVNRILGLQPNRTILLHLKPKRF